MKEKIIEFKNFSFKYQAQQAPTLQAIDLTIYKGEKVLIIGPSGSGKSTLGQCLNGLVPQIYAGDISGELLIGGQSVKGQSIYDLSQWVSTVLQDTDGQFIGLSVAEDIAFALENDVVPLPQMRQQVNHWADILDLVPLLERSPQQLSGGQKQRVSLAGVLIDESPILLFDEPLANLDPKTGLSTIELIDRLHRQQETTTIIIEHRLEEVLHRPVDRLILMDEGRLVFNGRPEDLLATDILAQHGIRAPLYLTALRQLGYSLSAQMPLADLAALDLPSLSVPASSPQPAISTTSSPLLEVKQVCFAYDDQLVLSNLDLTVYAGEKLAIVGPNGAGKSTLAKLLCQFVQPQAGQLMWRGQDISQDSVKMRAEKIGYVLQNPNQMISQTMIFDEVALGLRLRGVPEDEVATRVQAVLEVCGLAPFRHWPISALSYGQKKRVTIAAILVLGVEMLILDEPTAGQDEQHYQEMMRFLDELSRQGHAIVMITHDMQLMLEYADRTLVIGEGRVLADERPEAILNQPTWVAQAHLRLTSLYHLAEKLGVDPVDLTRYYIDKRGQLT